MTRMTQWRRLIPMVILGASLVLSGGALPALAIDELNTTVGITAAGAPLAMHGFDPVALFTTSTPTPGSAAFAAAHDGATYYLSSKENLDVFKANPAKFAPAFGGFCAYGVSVGKKFDGDPRYFTISGGKLYLNLNEDISQKFKKDVPGNIAKAEKQWHTIANVRIGDL